MDKDLIVVRGGGDLATGAIQKLRRAGFAVVVLETVAPTAIRRTVSLSEAVRLGEYQVEDMLARRVAQAADIAACHARGVIPVLIDEEGASIPGLCPACVVDAILAKRNLGTRIGMAPVVIGVGPGFTANVDAHAVIETQRGHDLGRVLFHGAAAPDTGVPGEIGGRSTERVVRAPVSGVTLGIRAIGDAVTQGEPMLSVGGVPCPAPFDGLLRGLIADGLYVRKGMKIADVDPRADADWRSISDKARCVGGGVLEAFLYLRGQGGNP